MLSQWYKIVIIQVICCLRNKVWICEFCGTKNTIEIEAGEIPKEGEILYLQQPQNSPKHDTLVSGITKDSIVIFCVDTSGSMGVTTEVHIITTISIPRIYHHDYNTV